MAELKTTDEAKILAEKIIGVAEFGMSYDFNKVEFAKAYLVLLTERQGLVDALKFYANQKNYHDQNGGFYFIQEDEGQRARQALGEG